MGKTYMRVNNIPVAQVYRIAVDNRDPYWVYAGLQDNHSWMGPSATRHWLGILNQDWVEIGFSDGTGKAVDIADWRKVYSSSSGGNLSPRRSDDGRLAGHQSTRARGRAAVPLRLGRAGLASRHTSGTVYLGGNRLFTSKDFGSTWTRSKDLTRSINRDEIAMMGVLNKDIKLSRNDGDAISEISNFAESPLDPEHSLGRTDDGNVQLTTDGGATWTELSGAITGVRNGTFVGGSSRRRRLAARRSSRSTRIAMAISPPTFSARPTSANRGRRSSPACRPTTPQCAAWQNIPGGRMCCSPAPSGALFVTHDSGRHWTKLTANLPTTRYDDILVHPRTKDLILGTHGRGIWILDDASPVAEWNPAMAASATHLFACAACDADAVLGRRLEHGSLFLYRRKSSRRSGVHLLSGAAGAARAADRDRRRRQGDS